MAIPEWSKKNEKSNFEEIKKRAVHCVRCGASILVHGNQKVFFCDECRGKTGQMKLWNWKQQIGASMNVDTLIQDLKR